MRYLGGKGKNGIAKKIAPIVAARGRVVWEPIVSEEHAPEGVHEIAAFPCAAFLGANAKNARTERLFEIFPACDRREI